MVLGAVVTVFTGTMFPKVKTEVVIVDEATVSSVTATTSALHVLSTDFLHFDWSACCSAVKISASEKATKVPTTEEWCSHQKNQFQKYLNCFLYSLFSFHSLPYYLQCLYTHCFNLSSTVGDGLHRRQWSVRMTFHWQTRGYIYVMTSHCYLHSKGNGSMEE